MYKFLKDCLGLVVSMIFQTVYHFLVIIIEMDQQVKKKTTSIETGL